jgi:thiamine-phosphate diphosphorylase
VKLHALVADLQTAEAAVAGGATVVQLRLKHAPTDDVVRTGTPIRALCRHRGVAFVVNDDVDAGLELAAHGVHLGRSDTGAERVLEAGLLLGLSASSVDEALEGESLGAAYIGAGPVWATPSKADADPPIGPAGLAAICEAVSVPVVAIGGIDADNAAECVKAGAAGVAVVRAAADAGRILAAIDAAR